MIRAQISRFGTMEYISDRTKFLHPHQVFHILSAKNFFLSAFLQNFYSLAYHFFCSLEAFIVTDRVKESTQNVFAPKMLFFAKREESE